MAKAKRKSKSKGRKRRGTGNVITTRRARTSGLGALNKPGTFAGAFIPPLIGGGLTALSTLAIAKMAQQQQQQQQQQQLQVQQQQLQQQQVAQGQAGVGYTRSHWHQFGLGNAQQQGTGVALAKWAPAIGVVVGGLSSAALYSMSGKHAGFGAAAGAIGVGGALLVYRLMNSQQQQQATDSGTGGWGAIVPEYGTSGLGAIVMEPESAQGYNAYSGGQDVAVRGLGSGLAGGLGAQMDVSAFGPASF